MFRRNSRLNEAEMSVKNTRVLKFKITMHDISTLVNKPRTASAIRPKSVEASLDETLFGYAYLQYSRTVLSENAVVWSHICIYE